MRGNLNIPLMDSDHSWGNKEIKDWEFVRDENGNIVVDESHPDWWQDKKNPDRHGIRIPVLDENGVQKVGTRNRKQWKRVLTDATGWNNPKNCELWRSEWANVCNAHLKTENHIDATFLSATIGYGTYYVCRLSLNVIKKPIVDNGVFSETELGIIGSVL